MEQLLGTYAQVHPLLNDPAGKQGQIGMITDIDIEGDNVYISFEKGQQALYSSNALFVLKKSDEISTNAISNVQKLSKEDFKTLLEISLKAQSIFPVNHKTALEMSTTNNAVRAHSQNLLQDKLGLVNNNQVEVEQSPIHRR